MYQYHKRPIHFLDYHCLDFNEYQGEIASSTKDVLKNTELLAHYSNIDDDRLLLEVSKMIQVPASYLSLTNGADEALFHSLLIHKLNKSYNEICCYFPITYDHFIHFANMLDFKVSSRQPSLSNKAELDNKIVYMALPNNPTGQEIPPEQLKNIIQNSNDSFWILDLTYIFYSNYKLRDYIFQLSGFQNILVTVSFSKGFPLAGLRMAFMYSQHQKSIEYFKNQYNKKTVGIFAKEVALDCLKTNDFYQDQRRQIWNNRVHLSKLFQDLAEHQNLQLKCLPIQSQGGNFFRMKGPLEDRNKFVDFLYSLKIIVRNKEKWDFLRVTSVSDKKLKKIRECLSKVMN